MSQTRFGLLDDIFSRIVWIIIEIREFTSISFSVLSSFFDLDAIITIQTYWNYFVSVFLHELGIRFVCDFAYKLVDKARKLNGSGNVTRIAFDVSTNIAKSECNTTTVPVVSLFGKSDIKRCLFRTLRSLA